MEDAWQSSRCSLPLVVCTEMLKEGNVAGVALCGIQSEMVGRDPPLVSPVMSLHNQQDQAPRQRHPKPPAVAVDDLKTSSVGIDHDLDPKAHSYGHSAILHRPHLIERLRGTMDDETVNAEVENRVLRWDQST